MAGASAAVTTCNHTGGVDARPPSATPTALAGTTQGGDREMGRKSHLTTAQFAILNDACIPVAEAFDSHPYLVGSATERPDFRDVDLRLILADEEFDRLFDGRVLLWSLICLAVGQYLCSVTGLPIDFQIQRMTEANEKHPDGARRHHMGMRARPLAGGGDATNFSPT